MLGHTSNQNLHKISTLSKKLKLILSFSVRFVFLKQQMIYIKMKISFIVVMMITTALASQSGGQVKSSKTKQSNKSLLNNPLSFYGKDRVLSTFTFTYKGFTLWSNLFPDLTDGAQHKKIYH